MNIVFFGSGDFAVPLCEALHQKGLRLSLIVTQPDRSRGRHLHLSPTSVKSWAQNRHLEIFQPMDINLPSSLEVLKNQHADFFVVASYGQILSGDVLALPKKICVNIHASLLPKYRGAAPVARALMNGERTTGITFMKMCEKMDAGDILASRAIRIQKTDNARTLEDKLSRLGAASIDKILCHAAAGKIKTKRQNEKTATYAPRIKKQEGCICWERSCLEIFNRFRGCYGWPGSFTYYRNKLLKILDLVEGKKKKEGNPGEIVFAKDNALEVCCGQGTVLIKEVLPESHKKMTVKSFLAGHQVKTGEFLSEKPLQEK